MKLTLMFLFASGHWFLLFSSWTMSLTHCSCFWDSQVKALDFTALSLKQHCTLPRDRRYECVYTLRCVCHVIPPNCLVLPFFLLLFCFVVVFLHQRQFKSFRYGKTVTFVWDTTFLRPLPKSPPSHHMPCLPSLCKDQRVSYKAMRCPNFFQA